MTLGWLDCAAGASGDMLLGAVVDAGVPVALLQEAVDAVGVDPVRLTAQPTIRHGLGATTVDVDITTGLVPPTTRTWAEIRGLLEEADLAADVRTAALSVFARLAHAEATVHRSDPQTVHFHEVGAQDAVADIVGGCAGLLALGIEHLSASRVTLGSGTVRSAHGLLPVPAPAVLELFAATSAPTWAGPAAYEMCTPTGAALLATHVQSWGPMPPMVVHRIGTGAGGRDLHELPNVLRLVLGDPIEDPADAPIGAAPGTALLLETNVDDLDPRLWPEVLMTLLEVGAADAWLTPILMKKGRPAHTLHVLCTASAADRVRSAIFAETSTIGLRESIVGKRALVRQQHEVTVDGQVVRVKTAYADDRLVNGSVEYVDVVAAAAVLGRPVKTVLAQAQAAAHGAGLLP